MRLDIAPGLDCVAARWAVEPARALVADRALSERRAALRQGTQGNVHSWELVTAVDGPGTRLTLFLAGCPLRCLYCHNPDTWTQRNGELMAIDDVMARISRYTAVLKATGGGVTVSGGEPLQQAAFTGRILRACKDLGLHTALDTSGFLGAKASDELLGDTDLVLLDVKSGLADTYRATTGRALAPTLEFGRRLAVLGKAIWLRFVLVPGLTDAYDNVEAVSDYAASLPTVERVEVLPFHQMGQDKWSSLGLDYELAETKPPEPGLVERVRRQFAERGLTVF